jgi:hypothetical protein
MSFFKKTKQVLFRGLVPVGEGEDTRKGYRRVNMAGILCL